MNDPIVKVATTSSQEFGADWNINMNLTDRWGGLIEDWQPEDPQLAEQRQHAMVALSSQPHLLKRLQEQMWDEVTFIARKDGEFGILFEVEYESVESDGGEEDPARSFELKSYDAVVKELLDQAEHLQSQFPQVQFCVPSDSMVFNGRPAIWGFAKDGALDDEQRKALGGLLLDFAYGPKVDLGEGEQPMFAPAAEPEHEEEAESTMGARP